MIKETISYVDYNGVERTEDYYFNLTRTELMKMEMSADGGLAEKLQKIIDSKDARAIMDTFENLLLTAYGVKCEDGKRFMKSKELRDAFAQTEAFDQLYTKLITDADAASKFINGVIPADVAAEVAKKTQDGTHPALLK